MKHKTSGIRKAAILVASLDRPAADRVLEQMDPQQALLVRQAMVDLGEIDPQEQRRIIDEFFRIRPMVPQKDPPGIELDSRPASRQWPVPSAQSSDLITDAAVSTDHWPDPADGPPFRFLREAEAEKLARILVVERPQTIALVLSHLPPEQAGSVLVRFARSLQVDVIRRLVDLEETEPEILREVERALESRLSEQVRMQRRRAAGLSAVAGILDASSQRVEMQILENLALHDQQLADKLGRQQLQFSDLACLADTTLATVFAAADPQLAVLALVGAPPELLERLLRQLPQSEAKFIRHELDHLKPIRLSDVEEARRQIAQLARRLAIEGRITLPCHSKSSFPRAETLQPVA